MRTIELENLIDISYSPTDEPVEYYLPEINIDTHRGAKTYHSKAIQQKARISAMQINHWTRMGVIIPFKPVRGTGKMHLYDHQNLVEAMICRELSQYSINFGVMKEVLDYLRNKILDFDISISYATRFMQKYYEEENRQIKEWIGKAPGEKGEQILKIMDGRLHKLLVSDRATEAVLDIISGTPEPKRSDLEQWVTEGQNIIAGRLNALMEDLEDEENKTPPRKKRKHTIWDFFKYYPQEQTIFLVLWKESIRIETAEPKTGDYHIYVTTDRLDEILCRSLSAIVINLTLILAQAGSFFDEGES